MIKNTYPKQTFSHRLKTAREAMGLTQRELGKLTEMPNTSISHFERGARMPTIDTLYRLARVLEVTADYLIGRSSYRNAHEIIGYTAKTWHALFIAWGALDEIAHYSEDSLRSMDANWCSLTAQRAVNRMREARR